MANSEHVELLLTGLESIEAWRAEHPEDTLDLTGAELKSVDLEYGALKKADFRNALIENARFSNCEISKSSFEGATFNRIYFNNADLMQVDFSKAKMNDLSFTSSSLSGVIFNSARLKRANFLSTSFRFCTLNNANLCDSEISYTGFHGSTLHRTDLSNAELEETTWNDINLSQTKGLNTIQHNGPSSLGIDTLERSHGKIPDMFLRGCGFSDQLIEFVKSHFANSDSDYYSCFISYSHADKSFAKRLYNELQQRGIRCWLDEHQILPGDNIYDRIDHGIRIWDKVLLCASRHSLTSGWVNDELKHAFAKEKKLFKERGCEVLSLIPLNLDGYLFSDWNHPNKNQMLERMAPDFTGWETDNAKFEQQLERVVKALQTNNTGRDPEPPSKL